MPGSPLSRITDPGKRHRPAPNSFKPVLYRCLSSSMKSVELETTADFMFFSVFYAEGNRFHLFPQKYSKRRTPGICRTIWGLL